VTLLRGDLGRFRIERQLGRGGMGEVYEAYDRQLRLRVALKTVRFPEAESLLLFKREFRALTDVSHRNLVTLYELVLERERPFFSMELLRGADLLRHVWGVECAPDCLETSPFAPASPPPEIGRQPAVAPPRVDAALLRATLGQLVEGVGALHRCGYLHRDIKPSNVAVTPAGRLVLLDFGVIGTIAGRGALSGSVGTPGYMAPEVAAGEVASPASDWYAVGVVLYQALTGALPRPGASSARRARPELAEDLGELCDGLLSVSPGARPDEAQLRAALGLSPLSTAEIGAAEVGAPPEVASAHPLVGREAELQQLHEALALAVRASGCGVIVRVHAGSGMGKTSLVQRFLQQAQARRRALVLAGRCYERESLPFKAIDAVVDALAQHLAGLSARRRAALLPADADALARVFPVLGQAAPPGQADPQEAPYRVRLRAGHALRGLLQALTQRRQVVLFIDDAQWGDADSAAVLEQLLAPPNAPDLLLVLAYRTEEAVRSPLLRALDDPGSALAHHPYVQEIALGPLAGADARRLVEALLGDEAGSGLAAAAKGNPYLLHELVRYHKEHAAKEAPAPRVEDLDAMIHGRVAGLPSRERELLELVAVGGNPLPLRIVHLAAGLAGRERAELLPRLQAAGWVRLSGRGGDDRVEPYHDRIREAVA
jgi:eukaryotic-like serine/threonine-protein kinase